MQTIGLYIRDISAAISRPVKELKSFKQVKLMQGESTKVVFEITDDMFYYYNENGEYCLDDGQFIVMVGESSADDALQTAYFTLQRDN